MKNILLVVCLWSCSAPLVVGTIPPNNTQNESGGIFPPYDQLILSTIKDYPLPKLPCDPVTFIKAIVKAESDYNPNSVYKEPAPLNNLSIGLMQLSLTDQKNWKLDCGWKTEEDLKNGASNISCGIKLLSKLCAKYPKEDILTCGGKYWSTLRPSRSGYKRFKSVCQ